MRTRVLPVSEVGLEDWRLLKNMPVVPIRGKFLIERNRIGEGGYAMPRMTGWRAICQTPFTGHELTEESIPTNITVRG